MRVVIADDDATSRLVLGAIARRLGHECLIAEDGAGAWELLSAGGVEVLLTDWKMPGVEGPELCRRVREELSEQYTYVVLVTALGHPEEILEGMRAGADDYLVKPVEPFSVEAKFVAAERVTNLHSVLTNTRAELERVNSGLLGQSLTDSLTGVGNRRRMEVDLARIHAHAQRTGHEYSVTMFDIDHFKLFNDAYGHQSGDETLRRVAQCMERSCRAGDSVYRYGGEELLVVHADTGPRAAMAAADRLRASVSAANIPHGSRPTPPPIVTVSGGVASWRPGVPLDVADVVRQADLSLFEAKAGGRNRVCQQGEELLAGVSAVE